MNEETEVFMGSGNVFADMGLPNPEERQLKAHLSIKLEEAIKSKRLTRKRVAQKIGLNLDELKKVMEGDLSGFSVGQLVSYLNCLDRDVTLTAVVQERSATAEKQTRKTAREVVTA